MYGSASAFVIACAHRPDAEVGMSRRGGRGAAGKDTLDGGFIDGTGSLPPGYRSTFTKINKARFPSQGHASGRWEVDVWANELAQKAMATRARQVPLGAIVVEEHYEREGPPDGGARMAGPVMVMEKRPPGYAKEHGDWRWVVIGSMGQLVKDGVIETCAACHDEAPMDGLFPVTE